MIAILGIIPVILIGIIFLLIDPTWSILWLILVACAASFMIKKRHKDYSNPKYKMGMYESYTDELMCSGGEGRCKNELY